MVTRGSVQSEPTKAEFLPLTECMLKWLPGPRWLRVTLWALLPFIRLLELIAVMHWVGQELTPDYLAYRLPYELVYAFLVVLSFWAVGKWTREVKALQPTLTRFSPGGSLEVFRDMTSRSGPLLLSVVLMVVSETGFFSGQGGVLAGLLLAPLALLTGVPVIGGFWVYLSVLMGLNRLGTHKLALEPFPEDPSLGLRPVGALAFSVFWVFALGIVPLLLVSIRSPTDQVINLMVFLVGVTIFFLSLWRLHQQMLAARLHYLEQAREIFREALQPIQVAFSLEKMCQQAPLLGVALILEHVAEAIQRWPFDDRALRIITTIATSVVVGLISRLIISLLGM